MACLGCYGAVRTAPGSNEFISAKLHPSCEWLFKHERQADRTRRSAETFTAYQVEYCALGKSSALSKLRIEKSPTKAHARKICPT